MVEEVEKENGVVEKVKKGDDVIEINFRKYLEKARENPWMVSSFVLGLLLLGALIFGVNGGSGVVVGESEVSNNVLGFLNSQVEGEVELTSIDLKSGYYEIVVNYQGQSVPIYATLDGKNLIADLIPLSGLQSSGDLGNTEDNGRVNLQIPEDVYVKGQEDAPVTIVEFSDFECPFCGKFYSGTYQEIVESYVDTGKVKFVYIHFPLGFHENAMPAALATECAGEQGKFFEMHDKIFENQQFISEENYKVWAVEIGLNSVKFNECFDSNKYEDKINSQLAIGSSVGVSGTPGFLIGSEENGYVKISGVQSFSAFEQIIEAELGN